jgi:hypothetical protein
MMPTPMATAEPKYRFVTFEGATSVRHADDSRGIRSHVRKSVLSSYRTRNIQENFRFYTPPQIHQDSSNVSRRKRAHSSEQSDINGCTQNGCHLLRNCSPSHPFTAYICKHVPLSVSRIDGLLKSGQSYVIGSSINSA